MPDFGPISCGSGGYGYGLAGRRRFVFKPIKGRLDCVTPTSVQKVGIAIQGTAAKAYGKTLLAGLGVSGGAGSAKVFGIRFGLYGSASVQIAVSPNGNAAYVISFTAPAGVTGQGTPFPWATPTSGGKGVLFGAEFGASNATDPSQLAGGAVDVSGSFADGIGIGGDLSTNGSISQGNVTLGFGVGGRGGAGAATHTMVIPFCHE